MKTKYKLLFVCLGNICRSPAAQGIMQSIVHQSGKDELFELDSAGIGDWHVGQLPDSRMIARGLYHGYQFNHHARQFHANTDFDYYDYILIMDNNNYKALQRQARTKEELSKVVYLADYLQAHPNQKDIPDPYYGNEADFDFAIELLEDACQALFESLSKRITSVESPN